MKNEPITLQSASFVILHREGKMLLMRRANTAWNDGYFELPHGDARNDESGTSAAVRVAREDLGIGIDPQSLEFALVSHGLYPGGKAYFNTYFRAAQWTGQPVPMHRDRYDAYGWYGMDDLPENLAPEVQLGLELVHSAVRYVEFGFDGLGGKI